MTREEAINIISQMIKDEEGFLSDNTVEAHKIALKALEQEPILEKIKAEIMQLYYEVEVVDYDHNDISRIKKAHWVTREEVLWIIDKYNSHPITEDGVKLADKDEQNLSMKQEPILDKIYAEIDSAKMPKNRMSFFRDGIDCALQIIDKYRDKAESEDKE